VNSVLANTGNCLNKFDFKCKYNNELKQYIHAAAGPVDIIIFIAVVSKYKQKVNFN
jgi:hypothetical protein